MDPEAAYLHYRKQTHAGNFLDLLTQQGFVESPQQKEDRLEAERAAQERLDNYEAPNK